MLLDEFLYNHQYKRKISLQYFIFSKQALTILAAVVIYLVFFKTNTKYDAFAYLGIMLYGLRSYQKTKMIFSDKLCEANSQDKKILVFDLIAKAKMKNKKRKQK